jgi:hypothetical protein
MNQLQIGDKIEISPGLGPSYVSTIIRVTKTKAIGDYPGNEDVFLEFKRNYTDFWGIRPYSPIKWDTTKRKLIKQNDQ